MILFLLEISFIFFFFKYREHFWLLCFCNFKGWIKSFVIEYMLFFFHPYLNLFFLNKRRKKMMYGFCFSEINCWTTVDIKMKIIFSTQWLLIFFLFAFYILYLSRKRKKTRASQSCELSHQRDIGRERSKKKPYFSSNRKGADRK